MGKVSSQSFYAVARGRQIGIYNSWSECRSQTHGFTNARFKKFSSYEEANNFVKENSNKSSSGVQRVFKAGKKSKENTAGQINRVVSAEEGWYVDERDWNYDPDLGYTLNKEGWVKVFTDGACSNNGRRGAVAGIGAYFGPGSPKNISEPVSGDHQTNNSAEIQAISQAIQSVKNEGRTKVVIYTDSKFAINSVELWLEGWKQNGWKKSSGGDVINKADFIQLDDIRKGMSVKFIHVRGHQGIHGNEMADQLAREGAQ
uniref:Ribonuclease H1 n=1 Tax=Caligus rogercresseyi TaxID=217165 RepID=C1BPL6_CALRO|nr:Ribonuclease H1 [Caligus rogercresseyi]